MASGSHHSTSKGNLRSAARLEHRAKLMRHTTFVRDAIFEKRSQPPVTSSWWLVPPDQFSQIAKDQASRIIAENRGSIVIVNTIDALS